ncbi:hypothetical protein UFOVP974_18 [uncultured Caudovirales phage]|uniref:Uncharacterized protein n=1 Tax=uncultured Caudovirales phage TaxID=2100421 RepID=A0A6J5Q2Z1_9CAUD|nr:hypothetical protein UFOVP974_18 [uncultured Caudovirales phage]CAB4194030.1 hypothetical protein UFOVP1256_6 [uncultured Caudovirales phage]CAB4222182.1 hypothetical protein UFOVP1643_28 [uncultured Caudovirales phage]
MTLPSVSVLFDFSNGPIFGYPFTIGDPAHGVLGVNILADNASDIVDISNQVGKISIRRGYNLLQDQWQAGTASVRVYDETGAWNPQNPASPYFGKLIPLRKMRIAGDGYFLFSGYTTAYNYTYPKDMEIGFVDIELSDGFRLLSMANVTTVTGATAGQDTGTRINKILDMVSFPNSMRDVDTGGTETTVQADPGTARTSLQAIKNIEFCEQGAAYFAPSGNFEFKSRAYVISKSGQNPTNFANDGSGIGYKNIVFAFDDKLIINQANMTRSGGSLQNAFNSTSIDKYFPHSINYSDLMVQTDAQALDIAKIYVATRAETTIRIDAITLDLNATDAAGDLAALTLDFFDTIAIKNVAQDGTTIEKTLQCMGVTHEITPSTWNTIFVTSEPIVDGFIIGSSLYGIIGTSVMTY